jgi:curved DNA-binding protein CbpA
VVDGPITDYYALLGERRSPWLDTQALQARFHALAADQHPDRAPVGDQGAKTEATARFAALNAAYHCLREPKERVAHLLVLESGEKPADVQRIPPGTIELFNDVGAVCRAVDSLLAEREAEPSPMRRLQSFERGLEWSGRIEDLRARIQTRQEALLGELLELDAVWSEAPPVGDPARRRALPLQRLAELSQLLGYFARWAAQLDERLTRLAL